MKSKDNYIEKKLIFIIEIKDAKNFTNSFQDSFLALS